MDQFFQQLVNGLSLGFSYALIAIGFTLIFGTLRVLNFAYPHIMMLAAFVTWQLNAALGWNLFLALFVAVLVSIGITLLINRTLIQTTIQRSFVAPFLATLGASLILTAAVKKIWGTDSRTQPAAFGLPDFTVGSVKITGINIAIGLSSVVIVAVLALLIYRTPIGLQVRASAESIELANLAGVNGRTVAATAMSVSGVLAAIAGVFLAISFGVVSPFMADQYGLKGMVAMILGGLGSLKGAVIAGVSLGIVEVMAAGYLASTWRDAVAFGALVLVLLIRPYGLFGKKGVDVGLSS
jgi:branched-subunit amino acid ABC-type transport system permease component